MSTSQDKMYMENLHSLSEITQNIKHKTSITCRQYAIYLEIFFSKIWSLQSSRRLAVRDTILNCGHTAKKNWAAKT